MIVSRRRKSKKIVVMLGEEAQLTDGGATMAPKPSCSSHCTLHWFLGCPRPEPKPGVPPAHTESLPLSFTFHLGPLAQPCRYEMDVSW